MMINDVFIDTVSARDSLFCVCSQNVEPLSNWYDWVSFFASIATIICFLITCIQLYKVKSVSEQLRDAVNDNNRRIRDSITLSKVTDALRLSETVLVYIRKEHYELAAMKLFELNNMAIEVAAVYQNLKEYQLKLASEMNHLNDMATNKHTIYSASYSMSTILQFNNALKEIDTQIKSGVIKIDKV